MLSPWFPTRAGLRRWRLPLCSCALRSPTSSAQAASRAFHARICSSKCGHGSLAGAEMRSVSLSQCEQSCLHLNGGISGGHTCMPSAFWMRERRCSTAICALSASRLLSGLPSLAACIGMLQHAPHIKISSVLSSVKLSRMSPCEMAFKRLTCASLAEAFMVIAGCDGASPPFCCACSPAVRAALQLRLNLCPWRLCQD